MVFQLLNWILLDLYFCISVDLLWKEERVEWLHEIVEMPALPHWPGVTPLAGLPGCVTSFSHTCRWWLLDPTGSIQVRVIVMSRPEEHGWFRSLGFLLISLPGWLILKDGGMSSQKLVHSKPPYVQEGWVKRASLISFLRTWSCPRSLCLKSAVDVGALLI